MMEYRKTLAKGLVALGVLTLPGALIARPAPDFTLNDIAGKACSLADYKGKYVVLEWTNPDCPFVKKHYQGSGNMPALQKKYGAQGVVWLSVSSSAPGKQGNYTAEAWAEIEAKRGAAPTAMLLDPDGTVGRAYGAKTTPHMFVINPAGEIIYEGAIDDESPPSVSAENVAKSKNLVAAALDAAMAGEPVQIAVTPPYGCSVKY